ncbi:hypothetical protein AKO1_007785 [Acrasis kona]|uniref:PPPDE domain-containing protein n=1 Tax=Acrasis kona TaxID=1008807 RepID=A0AAW2YRT3_9EUKA
MPRVFLNVYDITGDQNDFKIFGLGLYHTGVEVDGMEFTFGESGITQHDPRKVNGGVFKEAIDLGESKLTKDQVLYLSKELGKEGYEGKDYNVTKKNCNHFTKELCNLIFKKDDVPIPKYINRMAWWGQKLPFLISPVQSPTTPQSPLVQQTTSPGSMRFNSFSGGGRSLNGQKSSSFKDLFNRTNSPKTSSTNSPTADREQILRATQARFAQ